MITNPLILRAILSTPVRDHQPAEKLRDAEAWCQQRPRVV
jgi:hypothetical protein